MGRKKLNMEEVDFISFLDNNKNKEMYVILKGIISMEFLIQKLSYVLEERELILKQNEKKKIGLNLKQLMKVRSISSRDLIVEFDQLQSIEFKIKN